MRRRLLHATLIAISVFFICAIWPLEALTQQVVFAKVNSPALAGNIVGDSAERNVSIYLPQDYAKYPNRRYPVVYLLHGYTGNNLLWTGQGYLGKLNVAHIADMLVRQKNIKPMILVCPDASNCYRGSCYTNSSVTGNWADFVAEELVEYVDKTYRTIANVESRGIAGHSLGAYGALKLGIKYPTTYAAVYAMSPAQVVFKQAVLKEHRKGIVEILKLSKREQFDSLHWLTLSQIAFAAAVAPNPHNPPFFGDFPLDKDGRVVDAIWKRWLEHDLYTMIDSHRGSLEKLKAIRLDCGTSDILIEQNRQFAKALRDAGIPHAYEEYNGNHTDRIEDRIKTEVLPFFSQILKFEADGKTGGAR